MTENNKDFDHWNERKKLIHSGFNKHPYYERDVWWCSLGVNVGFEEDGDGERSERPVVIIKGFNEELCWVIPLSTSTKTNRYYIPVGIIDGKSSSAIISQMRPVDTKRLINWICCMEQEYFDRTKQAVRKLI